MCRCPRALHPGWSYTPAIGGTAQRATPELRAGGPSVEDGGMPTFDFDLHHPDEERDRILQRALRAIDSRLPDGEIVEDDGRAILRLTQAETQDAGLARAMVLRDGLARDAGLAKGEIVITTASWRG